MVLVPCLIIEVHHIYSNHFQGVIGGVNNQTEGIGLRKIADQNFPVIEWLPAGAFAPVQYEGTRWAHIIYNNEKYALPKKHFSLGYTKIYGSFIVTTPLLKLYNKLLSDNIIFSHLGMLISTIYLFFFYLKYLINSKNPRHKVFPKTIRKPYVSQYLPTETICIPSAKVPDNTAISFGAKSNIAQRNLKDTAPPDALKKEISQLYRSKTFLEALNVEYRGAIEEMENAANQIHIEFNDKKEKAKILGVDLDSSKLSGLVKGRLFEIFSARIWDADKRATIIAWTPDKGINEGIYVKSNGDPDFLVELKTNAGPRKIAIECKYRSLYTHEASKKETILWINYSQYKRYIKYEDSSGVTVFLLTGINGDPKSPDHVLLAPISKIRKHSIYREIELKKKKRFKGFVASQSELEAFEIQPSSLIAAILRNIQDGA